MATMGTEKRNHSGTTTLSEDQDLIRAEGEGMTVSEAPVSTLPHVERIALLRAHGGAAVRRIRYVKLPVLRSRVASQIARRPLTSVCLALAAGIGLSLGMRALLSKRDA